MPPSLPCSPTEFAEHYARERSWAVVGASNDASKFGCRIYRRLRDAGYRVWPINRHAAEILGDPAFPTLLDLPAVPTVVNLVVPPGQAMSIIHDAIEIGVEAVWFQPGAENSEAARIAKQHGVQVVEDCILVRARDQSAGAT